MTNEGEAVEKPTSVHQAFRKIAARDAARVGRALRDDRPAECAALCRYRRAEWRDLAETGIGILNGEHLNLRFSLRELVRDLMPAERQSDRRRTMAQWLKARDAEGKPEPTLPPLPENERRIARRDEKLPASRRIPPRTAKW